MIWLLVIIGLPAAAWMIAGSIWLTRSWREMIVALDAAGGTRGPAYYVSALHDGIGIS